MARGSKKIEELKNRARNATRRAKEKKDDRMRMVTTIATGGLSGKLEQSGYLDRLPTIGPLPPMATAGALAAIGSNFMGGKAGRILDGVGTGLLTVAAYQFGKGQSISGDRNARADARATQRLGPGAPDPLAELDELERELDNAAVEGVEDEALAELEEAMEMANV